MRVVLQRVKEASVTVDGKIVGAIKQGLVVFACVMQNDGSDDIDYIIRKIPELRIFADENGKFNRSLLDVAGEILLISQFTLSALTKKGRRPYFADSAQPDIADKTLQIIAKTWQESEINVEQGIFGAMMDVHLINDGPVTIWMDSQNKE